MVQKNLKSFFTVGSQQNLSLHKMVTFETDHDGEDDFTREDNFILFGGYSFLFCFFLPYSTMAPICPPNQPFEKANRKLE